MLKKKKILVTGATGFVGVHLINELIKNDNYEIIATSRSKEKAKSYKWFDKVNFVEYDISDNSKELMKLFFYPDILIHLAWDGLSNYNDLIHIENNLFNHYKFIKNLANNGLTDITVIGTCFEYGLQSGPLKEDMVTKPITAYGLGKDSLRRFLERLKESVYFDFKWIRLFYVYGEGQSKKSLLSQLNLAIKNKEAVFNMSKGEQLRDYLDIKDVAKNIMKISLQNNHSGIFNCASGKPISIRSLVEEQIKKKNAKISLNLGYYGYPIYEPLAFWADISKLNTKVLNG